MRSFGGGLPALAGYAITKTSIGSIEMMRSFGGGLPAQQVRPEPKLQEVSIELKRGFGGAKTMPLLNIGNTQH